jgi:hypothetical protein
MPVIKWQDPPVVTRGAHASGEDPSWTELRTDLKAHPDVWGLVEEDTAAARLSVYRNHLKRGEGFLVRQAVRPDYVKAEGDEYAKARFDVYVKYVPEEDKTE